YDQQQYVVSGGQLVQNPIPNPTTPTPPGYVKPDNIEPHFYIYDVTKDTATELTFAQAQSYKLDSSNSSSDGYVIAQGNGGGDLFFGSSGDYSSWFIKGHNRSRKLNLKLNSSNYYNFQFLGWVE